VLVSKVETKVTQKEDMILGGSCSRIPESRFHDIEWLLFDVRLLLLQTLRSSNVEDCVFKSVQ
jgi:hypothetical protein